MPMSEEHKTALARGREESRAIREYLTALESKIPGRPVTKESLESRLESTNLKLDAEDNPLNRVGLLQKKLDLEEELSELKVTVDVLEENFIKYAKSYSERKGISYTAWRDFGVPATTLKTAGIRATRRR